MKYVSSGKKIVIGVSAIDNIFMREGISASNPTGTSWKQVSGNLKLIDSYRPKKIWGIAEGDAVYHSQA